NHCRRDPTEENEVADQADQREEGFGDDTAGEPDPDAERRNVDQSARYGRFAEGCGERPGGRRGCLFLLWGLSGVQRLGGWFGERYGAGASASPPRRASSGFATEGRPAAYPRS